MTEQNTADQTMKKQENQVRQKLYDDRFQREFNTGFTGSEMLRVQPIVNWIGSNKKVLDIGCSQGNLTVLLTPQQNEVYGVDISQEAIDVAISRGMAGGKVMDFETDAFPYEENSFDVAVAAEVVEHIFDIDSFLEKAHRVLKPGGELMISTPNLASFGRRLLLILGKNPLIELSIRTEIAQKVDYQLGACGHIRYFVKRSLFDLLEAHNFRIKRFTSDVINFTGGGMQSVTLASKFPTIGRSLIVSAEKR